MQIRIYDNQNFWRMKDNLYHCLSADILTTVTDIYVIY